MRPNLRSNRNALFELRKPRRTIVGCFPFAPPTCQTFLPTPSQSFSTPHLWTLRVMGPDSFKGNPCPFKRGCRRSQSTSAARQIKSALGE